MLNQLYTRWYIFDTEFQSHDMFYSSLIDSNISGAENKRGLLVWNHFNIKTSGEYHDLYFTLDVLVLSDVVLKFRQTLLFHFGLDPARVTPPQIIVGMLY